MSRTKLAPGTKTAADQLAGDIGKDRPRIASAKPQLAQQPQRLLIPHDVMNEQVIIATAMIDTPSMKWLVGRAKPDDFFGGNGGQQHSLIWATFVEMVHKALDYSPAIVNQVSGGKVDLGYLQQLSQIHKTAPPNIRAHVEALGFDRAKIEVARGPLQELLKHMQDQAAQPDVLRAAAKKVAVAFDGYGDRRHLLDPNELVRQQSAEILKRRQGYAVYPYGIDGLDIDANTNQYRLIPGAEPGGITAVTAVSGAGKSTLVARIALGLAALGRKVLMGAWEVNSGKTLELIAGMKLGLSRKRVKTGMITDDEHQALHDMMLELSEYIRFLEMPFGRVRGGKVDNDKSLDILHGYIADAACDVAIFDLFKRVLRQTDPDDEEQALVRMQAIAQETKVHCILVQQQRLKDIEQRKDKRPTRDGIKGTSAWVEIPDTILAPHRPALFKRVPDDTLEIIILKQRDGEWPLAVAFEWNAEFGSITGGRTIDYDLFDESAEQGDDKATPFFSSRGKK